MAGLDGFDDGCFKRLREADEVLIAVEFAAMREALKREDVAIIRVEQFYPWRNVPLEEALDGVVKGTPAVWVQEEPENMGAWFFLRRLFGESVLGRSPLSGIYRETSASPATGSPAAHKQEQKELIEFAFAERPRVRPVQRAKAATP